MEELKVISVEEFEKFKFDSKTGLVTVPEDYKLTKIKSQEEIIQEEIAKVEDKPWYE